jgi:hypothetical protein
LRYKCCSSWSTRQRCGCWFRQARNKRPSNSDPGTSRWWWRCRSPRRCGFGCGHHFDPTGKRQCASRLHAAQRWPPWLSPERCRWRYKCCSCPPTSRSHCRFPASCQLQGSWCRRRWVQGRYTSWFACRSRIASLIESMCLTGRQGKKGSEWLAVRRG